MFVLLFVYRVTFKEWPPYSTGKCAFFEVSHTLWDIITPNKPILVKTELQEIDFGGDLHSKTEGKVQKTFLASRTSYRNTLTKPNV